MDLGNTGKEKDFDEIKGMVTEIPSLGHIPRHRDQIVNLDTTEAGQVKTIKQKL